MTREESIKLTIKSLLEVVQTGAKNIEISVLDGYNKITVGFYVKVHEWAPSHHVSRAWNSLRLRGSFRISSGRKKLVCIDLYRVPCFTDKFPTEAERKRSRLAATAAGQAAMLSRVADEPEGE